MSQTISDFCGPAHRGFGVWLPPPGAGVCSIEGAGGREGVHLSGGRHHREADLVLVGIGILNANEALAASARSRRRQWRRGR
ncbi:MAG: hypothetical protein M9883_04595 [Methylobacteriaceae bacterium]|nr:hypothetical protein [Methylobacteriaceae bacterium]